jgi:hypothetical protein
VIESVWRRNARTAVESLVKAEIRRGTLKGAKIGFLAGLCLAALYLVILALGDTELDKSVGFTLLLVGFPTLFAIVPLVQGLGLQGGKHEGVALVLLTLSLNGALWGVVIGAVITLGSQGHRKWIRPQS